MIALPKNREKHNNQDQIQTSHNFSTVMNITLKPPKPFINKYFDSMSREAPIVYTLKEKHIWHHHSLTLPNIVPEVQNQDSLEVLD